MEDDALLQLQLALWSQPLEKEDAKTPEKPSTCQAIVLYQCPGAEKQEVEPDASLMRA